MMYIDPFSVGADYINVITNRRRNNQQPYTVKSINMAAADPDIENVDMKGSFLM